MTSKNNEIKYIINVIDSLENRGISLKWVTKEITSEKTKLINFLGPLIKVGLALIKNVLILLAKSVLLLLGLKVTISVTDAAIQNKIFWLDITTLMFSIEELNDLIKIVKTLKNFGLLIITFHIFSSSIKMSGKSRNVIDQKKWFLQK